LFVTRIFATHAQHLETLFHNWGNVSREIFGALYEPVIAITHVHMSDNGFNSLMMWNCEMFLLNADLRHSSILTDTIIVPNIMN
jgi:hypothetical protein